MDTETKRTAFVDLYLKHQRDFNVDDIIIYLQILDLKEYNKNYLKHFEPIEDNIKTFLNNMHPNDLKHILNKMKFQDVQALRPFIGNKDLVDEVLKDILNKMDPNDLKDILNNMDPTGLKDILNNMDPTDLKDILNKMEFQDVQALKPFIDNKDLVNEVLDRKVVDGGKRKPLTACTVSELKAKAKKRGINVTGLKKAEIIAKLRRR